MLRSKPSTGFTLIELLVVVAIIALLISILLPSLSKARETARTVQCASIERQFGIANHMYADESDNYFVPIINPEYAQGGGWWFQNTKYRAMIGVSTEEADRSTMPQGLLCPNVPDEFHEAGRIDRTYAMNREPQVAWTANHAIHRTSVQSPSQKGQMTDNNDPNMTSWETNYQDKWDRYGELHTSDGGTYSVAYRHDEGTNVLHYDGHASYYNKEEAFPTDSSGQPQWDQVHQIWIPYEEE